MPGRPRPRRGATAPPSPGPSPAVAPAERGPASRLLGERLRRLREDQKMSLVDAAALIRGSASKLSRLERGESPPKTNDVWDLVRHYGLPATEYDEIHELLGQVRLEGRARKYEDLTPDFLRRLISLEAQAKRICAYETHVVPGLLQTKEYAEVLVGQATDADPVEISRHVRVREERQRLLHRPHRPELIMILDESVLYRPVGGPRVMCDQMRHLRSFASDGSTDAHIRILRFDHEQVGTAPGFPVTHLQFVDGGPAELVYVEQLESADYVTAPARVRRYREVMDHLMERALPWRESVDFLDERIRDYAQQSHRSEQFEQSQPVEPAPVGR
ncbi:helix-turn-helix transcriptional regulator [Streptomyces sp. NPDC051555]|uniref:helix-turn-helix transcriptional regulator n=1 Tax=Streptomyces sp. NPDC051555 TaxID=3365657 RepID=UPI00378CB3E1